MKNISKLYYFLTIFDEDKINRIFIDKDFEPTDFTDVFGYQLYNTMEKI